MGALDDLVEVKTTTSFKTSDRVTFNLDRNFSKVLIVKINADFDIAARLIERKAQPRANGTRLVHDWNDFGPPGATVTSSAGIRERDPLARPLAGRRWPVIRRDPLRRASAR